MVVAIIIVMAVVIGFSVIMLIASLKNTKNQNQTIENNAEYAEEKTLKEYLEKFSIGSFVRKQQSLYDGWNAFYKDMGSNAKKCAELINHGAKIVLVDGTRPDHTNGQEMHIFAITPKLVIHRKEVYSKHEKSITSQIVKGARIYVHTADKTEVIKKDASVAGQAVAGAVIAGGVGAVVGAVNAMDTNAKGGKTKVVSTSQKLCGILFMQQALDCIIISKELIDKYGEPQVSYEPVKTKESWIYTGIPSFRGDIANKANFDALTNYVQNLINEIQK